MSRSLLIGLFALLLFWPYKVTAGSDANEQAIRAIVEQFKRAIQTKDSESFLRLFHAAPVSWVGVISSDTIELLVSKDPRFAQQPKIMPGTPKEFIEGIANSDVVTREETSNLRIIADRDVASVMFDYRLFKDDVLNNWGQENWQLINTTDGWKINAVNFSYTMNPALLGGQ